MNDSLFTISKKYNSLRIENEIKLDVPVRIYNDVLVYLNQNYSEKNLFKQFNDTSFHSLYSEEIFEDIYFDTPDYELLNKKNSVRYRKRFVIQPDKSVKFMKEFVQIKINRISSNKLERGEYKYPVRKKKVKFNTTQNPTYLVQKNLQTFFIKRLKNLLIDNTELQIIFPVKQIRKRYYIDYNSHAFATITIDETNAYMENDSIKFIEIELELNEMHYSASDSLKRISMQNISNKIKMDLMNKFPLINQNQNPKYNKAFEKLEIDLKNKLFLFKIIIIAVISAVVILILGTIWLKKKKAKLILL